MEALLRKALKDVSVHLLGESSVKYGEMGWFPSPEERYLRNIHLGIWHTDARDDAQIEENYGVVFSTNWLFGEDTKSDCKTHLLEID